jgi:hypothetical protein
MRRLLLGAAALAIASSGTVGLSAARADNEMHDLSKSFSDVSSVSNSLISILPGFDGPDKRHICIIDDPLDFYYCVWIPMP